MITVAAIRMEQFGVQFYQASLTARDVSKLVRFEVLSYGEKTQPLRGSAGKGTSKVNWDLLERRIAANDKSYQRQIIGKKIEELVNYYEQCREARNLPSIPGAVIIASEEPLRFEAMGDEWQNLGVLKVPEREGILRAIDGQHRLLALHNDIERFGHDVFHVPAVIFDRLPEDHVVQMFVTINAKHTRLNPSHLVSLAGRQLYSDPNLAAAHDVIRALTEREDSALHGDIKLLGVGRGRVAQAPLAQELKRLFESDVFGGPKKSADFRDQSQRFFVNYFKQVATLFSTGVERPQVQHQERAGAARLHPRRAGRGDAPGPGARRPGRLPRHRPRDLSVGPPHRRHALRDRQRVEAQRVGDRSARQGTAPRAAVPRRRGVLARHHSGVVGSDCRPRLS